ncbi:MAG TPA: hypothetical protein VLB44_16140 [Kofleriaceae bacterium]|nr:hypothetical protein [Kofleriaceae bacterium]
MTYRNDHDAALDRIDALEQENRRLADELARARPDANAARIESLEQANRRLAEQVARSTLPRRAKARASRMPASPVEWALVVTFGVVWLIVTIATTCVRQ